MATQLTDDDTHVERPGLRARGWWWIASALVVVLVTAWVWIGTHPAVTRGSYGWFGPGTRVADDGLEQTRLVIQENEAQLSYSVRNTGLVPFTVVGLEPDPLGMVRMDVEFQPDLVEQGSDSRLTESPVRVGRSDEVGLKVRVVTDGCLGLEPGSMMWQPARVKIRQLGITTTHELSTGLPEGDLYFPSGIDGAPVRSCRSGQFTSAP
ncbi:MAG TPA: hypothetical protein VFX41_02540 [Actinomycetales bacterium]|nr:hypothetical protein [Actinomycetales bacterium]